VVKPVVLNLINITGVVVCTGTPQVHRSFRSFRSFRSTPCFMSAIILVRKTDHSDEFHQVFAYGQKPESIDAYGELGEIQGFHRVRYLNGLISLRETNLLKTVVSGKILVLTDNELARMDSFLDNKPAEQAYHRFLIPVFVNAGAEPRAGVWAYQQVRDATNQTKSTSATLGRVTVAEMNEAIAALSRPAYGEEQQ